MKRLVLVAVVAVLLAFPALSVSEELTVEGAAIAHAASQAAVIVRGVADQAKVPRGDKDSVEIIGTVADAYSITDPCSGNPVRIVWVSSKAAPLNPVGGGCAGPSFATCASLLVGQRVRLQGILLTLPDPTTSGFNACDPGTWFLPPAPLQTFLITKVTK
jgi:hypothetical protein